MEISFRTKKLERIFSSGKELRKVYGERAGGILTIRIGVLKNASNLERIPATRPERRHQLDGRQRGQYAIDIIHPYRLLFEPNHDPVPLNHDGGIDLTKVTAITIVGVIDYH